MARQYEFAFTGRWKPTEFTTSEGMRLDLFFKEFHVADMMGDSPVLWIWTGEYEDGNKVFAPFSDVVESHNRHTKYCCAGD